MFFGFDSGVRQGSFMSPLLLYVCSDEGGENGNGERVEIACPLVFR